ncbi:hypothetical protein E0Z10_g632 [Xylaria hypoxylon]|uniref:Uncharacterized protein n=1 Tax=Xylaria hypoxylon TaxID=37992 RepID=A0A4Z0ZEK4_9PEZI|nr:hypothetical protein E0Z10_g632 [Xylaria hypoxylon]
MATTADTNADAASLPRPDLPVRGNHLRGLSDEAAHCSNLPAIRSDITTIECLQGLRQDIQSMRQDMQAIRQDLYRESSAGLREEMQKMLQDVQKTLKTNNLNMEARKMNGTTPGTLGAVRFLRPLINIHTHRIIESFPFTLQELDKLPEARIDILLRELGEEPRGKKWDKINNFRALIGVERKKERSSPFSQVGPKAALQFLSLKRGQAFRLIGARCKFCGAGHKLSK